MKQYITYILALMLLTACSSMEDFWGDSNGTPLTLTSVQTEQVTSRSIFDCFENGTTFKGEATLGLYLKASDGSSVYDGQSSGYDNIAYKTSDGTTWSCSSPIMLSSTEGTLYAYYPQDDGMTTFPSNPIGASIESHSLTDENVQMYDYMYATAKTVSDHTQEGSAYGSVSLAMNHALARIDLIIKKGTYTAAGSLTGVSFTGSGVASAGTLNIKDGTISDATAGFSATVSANTITTSGITYRCLIVPASTTAETVTLTCTIDGKAYTVSLGSLTLTHGQYYIETLTLNDTGLTVSSTTIGDWSTATTLTNTMNIPYVEINGVKWATMNLGATTVAGSPETAFGDYYAWGETEVYYSSVDYSAGKVYFNKTTAVGNGYSSVKTCYNWANYCNNSSGLTEWDPQPYSDVCLKPAYDAARANWGGAWRMPTVEEYTSLASACGFTFTGNSAFQNWTSKISTSQNITAKGVYKIEPSSGGITIDGVTYKVQGLLFVADASDTSQRVFFPACGVCWSSSSSPITLTCYNNEARYWSSTLQSDKTRAYILYISSASFCVRDYGTRCNGFSIRPVSD